jgi:hypothetical protein
MGLDVILLFLFSVIFCMFFLEGLVEFSNEFIPFWGFLCEEIFFLLLFQFNCTLLISFFL